MKLRMSVRDHALPVPNRSMLGVTSGLGAAATSETDSNKSKTKYK